MSDTADPRPSPTSAAPPQAAAPPRFSWPMRIFLGFLVFDMVFHSLVSSLTPYLEWCQELGIQRMPTGALPSAAERRELVANASELARLGARLESPDDILIRQLDLTAGNGLIVEEVAEDSAAETAGLRVHDVLEFDGKAVPNTVGGFARLLATVKENTPIHVLVLRRGKRETLKGLTLPQAEPPPVDAVAERVWEATDSLWYFFRPWPSARTRRKIDGWTGSVKFVLCWVTTRIGFINEVIRFDQRWTMFSPNVSRGEYVVRIRLVFADRSEEVVPTLSYPEDLTRYDSMRFLTEKVLEYESKLWKDPDLRRGYCNLIAHRRPTNDRGSPLVTIFLHAVQVRYPKPGEDAEAVFRAQNGPPDWRNPSNAFYEYDVKARKGYRL